MKLWLQDESDYPSGFAGGKISKQYPQLGMQGIVADIRVRVRPARRSPCRRRRTLSESWREDVPGPAIAQGIIPIPVPANGQLKWTVPNEGSTPQ
jgi:hypothetical protein